MRAPAIALLLAAAACAARDPGGPVHVPEPVALHRCAKPAMGTNVEITFAGRSGPDVDAACGVVFLEMERLEALLSEWRPESALSGVNAAAGVRPVAVPEELYAVVERSLEVAALTGGAFDPTFAALWGLWTFGNDGVKTRPPPALVEERRRLIDWRKVRLDPAARTIYLSERGMKLGLGGIAKGYATDRAVTLLRARGFRDFSVKAGGELFLSGNVGGRPWRVGIQDPRGPGAFAEVELSDRAFDTSGDYERFFLEDGVRWHHIIDPATGYPARGTRSATVLAHDALTADALGTALFVMGPEAGLALAERLPDVEAVLVGSDGRLHVSRGLRDRLRLLPTAPPPP